SRGHASTGEPALSAGLPRAGRNRSRASDNPLSFVSSVLARTSSPLPTLTSRSPGNRGRPRPSARENLPAQSWGPNLTFTSSLPSFRANLGPLVATTRLLAISTSSFPIFSPLPPPPQVNRKIANAEAVTTVLSKIL